MLKGAQASAPGRAIQFVDLMTWTEGRLRKAGRLGQRDGIDGAAPQESTQR